MRAKTGPFQQLNFTGCVVEDVLEDGRSLCRVPLTDAAGEVRQRVIFLDQGVPGDVAEVQVYGERRRQWLGKITRLEVSSPDRVKPICQHFGTCGGCKWQHLSGSALLAYKEAQVKAAFERIGGLNLPGIQPILASPQAYFYRNKLEFTFSTRRWLTAAELGQEPVSQPALGFHVPGFFDKVVQVERCWLQDGRVNLIRNWLYTYALAHNLSFYDIRGHTGLLRNLVFRTSRATGELLLLLIVGEDDPEKINTLFSALLAEFPWVSSLTWLYNPKANDSYSELPYQTWHGPGYLTERLGKYSFRIGPTSFFQTNSAQTERLYGVVETLLQTYIHHKAVSSAHKPIEVLYDLYAGAGSIGIFVSAYAAKVVGVEYNAAAVADAALNLALNGLSHLVYEAGDMAKLLGPDFAVKHGAPEVIITDPPRAGMDTKVTEQVLKLAPAAIIYVSCNPATQARDLALLADAYRIVTVQPVDMFPQTSHVENVVLLIRSKKP